MFTYLCWDNAGTRMSVLAEDTAEAQSQSRMPFARMSYQDQMIVARAILADPATRRWSSRTVVATLMGSEPEMPGTALTTTPTPRCPEGMADIQVDGYMIGGVSAISYLRVRQEVAAGVRRLGIDPQVIRESGLHLVLTL